MYAGDSLATHHPTERSEAAYPGMRSCTCHVVTRLAAAETYASGGLGLECRCCIPVVVCVPS